jgi:hypothetical protein
MEDYTVIVTVLCMGREVLHSSWALVGEELEGDVTLGGMKDGTTREDDQRGVVCTRTMFSSK